MTETARKPARRRARRGRGDELGPEIIAATRTLLADAGNSDAVSIRAVADAVGVTPPSIYLHFADKDALLEAVVADVLSELDTQMLAAAEGIDEPLERLCAYGMAYIRFAIEHPEHYRLATMERHAVKDGAEEGASHLDTVLAEAAFTHMMETVSACMDDGVFKAGDPVPVTLEMWAAAHGIASLLITKPFLPWGDPLDFAYHALGSAAIGRAVQDMQDGEMTPATTREWLATMRGQQ